MLVLGVSAGIANLDVRYDKAGLSIRTGWSRGAGRAANAVSPVPLSAYFAGPEWRPVWEMRSRQVEENPADAEWVTGVIWDDQQKAAVGATYRSRSGWLPYAEIAVGVYFVGNVAFAIDTYNFLAVPFLLLFVGGYYWAGISTLWEEYQSKIAFEKAQARSTAIGVAGN